MKWKALCGFALMIFGCSDAEVPTQPVALAVAPEFARGGGGVTTANGWYEGEEIYYVLAGEGVVTIGDEAAPIGKDEALVVAPNDVHSIANAGSGDLEIVVIGAATEKWMLDTIEVEPGARR